MKKATSFWLIFVAIGMLALHPTAQAQRCEESITGTVCVSEGNACSPPTGGFCRQATTDAGAPSGCLCTTLTDQEFIVSERSLVLPVLSALILALVVGFITYRIGRRTVATE